VTSAEWWAKVKQARERQQAATAAPVVAWRLCLGTHTADLELRDVPTVGVDVALVVDGDLRRGRRLSRRGRCDGRRNAKRGRASETPNTGVATP
jgi:hypothetical protein